MDGESGLSLFESTIAKKPILYVLGLASCLVDK